MAFSVRALGILVASEWELVVPLRVGDGGEEKNLLVSRRG
jgi:hypothetical protein